MSKTKRYNNFREFFEDEDRPRKKHSEVSQKKKDKMKQQFKHLDPKNIKEEDFEEFEDYE